MKKKLQVFVSSTYTDLIEERQAAVEAILDAGHIPAGMELFKAGNESQLKTIYRWIDESDVYMLILGGRYGSIEEESGLSYTELEYKYALSRNIPVFAIVLSQKYLTSKINKLEFVNAMEEKSPDKYISFKNFVMKKIIRLVDDCKDIKVAISSSLNELIHNNKLVGWVRANTVISDYSNLSSDVLFNLNQSIINEILIRNHSSDLNAEINNFSKVLSTKLQTILQSSYGILNCSERIIKLEFVGKNDTLNVTITKIWDYADLEYDSHPFIIKFMATERQAKTYKIISLIIDGEDSTPMIKLSINKDTSRKQFNYNVYSNEIPLHNRQCKITYTSSYECNAIDFFHSHRLNCLCNHLKTYIILSNEVRKKYTLVSSTFSPFSTIHYDDFKAKEMLTTYDEIITLPAWSLPGSGYSTSLKYKTSENHI